MKTMQTLGLVFVVVGGSLFLAHIVYQRYGSTALAPQASSLGE
jgi:hypothetical protein